MATMSVTLEGSALTGVDSHLMAAGLLEQLPTTVKLGRRTPAARPQVPYMAAFFDPNAMTIQLPESLNRRASAMKSLSHMYLNDRYGCCVIAGKAHGLGVWSANDSDSGGIIIATDQEILSQYVGICGPGDQGCMIPSVLDVMRTQGFTAGGKRYKIDGYGAVDWRNKQLVQATQLLFGASTIGINLPSDWTKNAVWDLTNSPIVGGHDVTPIDYDSEGVYVSSWGRLYLITWRAFTSTKWLEEYYAILAQSWYNNDKLAPCGFDVNALKTALSQLSHGQLPPLPDPAPPIPPVVPPDPVPGPAPTPIPWGQLLAILSKILPTVIADVRAGKSITQIIADVIRVLSSAGHSAERYGVTDEDWHTSMATLVDQAAAEQDSPVV